ncbi:hypothetical protein [Mycobacterium sp. 236(2023)]|uniref:hypothetical protein n=1 Tax=Mycobacterium sp. 236(2023) TaxID=3038163 RepID=UPI0024153C52|nr:hypothetical protein [Mycobacterium sp. 236(2023)]MDG4663193.1 hypothetical protein [Mycobacterium sp. 236(2023)]
MAGFIKKLFRIGKLPADMRTQAEAEGVIHLTDCIGVWARFTGEIPGRRSVGLVRGYGGALVLTNQRVLATVSALPGKSGRAADHLWTAPQTGVVKGTLSEEGLVLDIADLSTVDPQFSGTLSLTFKTQLTADELMRLPARAIAFDIPPMFVYRILGVPRG